MVVRGLTKRFPLRSEDGKSRRGWLIAVDQVDLEIRQGEVLGLVGESGSGKSTLARTLLRLIAATSGSVTFDGIDVLAVKEAKLKDLRRRMQVVFQDPHASLDPRMTVRNSIAAPLKQHGIGDRGSRDKLVRSLLHDVGLSEDFMGRYPHECSGGQAQRVAIARALSLQPDFVVFDEPTASLDVSIQAQILNLLVELKEERSLTYMFISHDLHTVNRICDRVAVMYRGRVIETASRNQIFESPRHPYTEALLTAIPTLDPTRPFEPKLIEGELFEATTLSKGCRFHPRCPARFEPCPTSEPPLAEVEPGHQVACFLYSGERLEDISD